jgi:branched-chain amino acid transport system permease protein
VIVGGRGTLIGPILATFVLYFLTASLGSQQLMNTNLVLGGILVIFVLLVPSGVIPSIAKWFELQRVKKFSKLKERRLKMRKHRSVG